MSSAKAPAWAIQLGLDRDVFAAEVLSPLSFSRLTTACSHAVCEAPTNMAVLKYWGKRDSSLNLPLNSSLSVTLHCDDLHTLTAVFADASFEGVRVWLNGEEQGPNKRVASVISLTQEIARKQGAITAEFGLRVVSMNSFPTAAGLASSASGYACLTRALASVHGILGEDGEENKITLSQLSAIARQGSGSACRSLFGGFVRWEAGFGSEEIYGLPSGAARDAAISKLEAAKASSAIKDSKGSGKGESAYAGNASGGFMMMAASGAAAETKAGADSSYAVNGSDKTSGSSSSSRSSSSSSSKSKVETFSSLPSVATDCGGEDSVAIQVFPESHWEELRALVLVVSASEKDVGSTPGMIASAKTSQLLVHRVRSVVRPRLRELERAIAAKDFDAFAENVMRDSNSFHAVCLDTFPPLLYMNTCTHAIAAVVHALNDAAGRAEVAYTVDAGPNVVLFCRDQRAMELAAEAVLASFAVRTDATTGEVVCNDKHFAKRAPSFSELGLGARAKCLRAREGVAGPARVTGAVTCKDVETAAAARGGAVGQTAGVGSKAEISAMYVTRPGPGARVISMNY